jgi:carbamoyl-phosphate synthase large subunit
MPKRTDIKSILIIGAGPIIIGQACEFDYSGTQACKALREEGYRIILVNSNPATIMTDPEMADATYIEPINWKVITKIIEKERPQALLPTMGGQTALNCALDLAREGVLEKYNIELIGASREAIDKAEDRELFRKAMNNIRLETPHSALAHNMDDAWNIQETTGFPVIIRPSFTLGGTGGGVAYNRDEFVEICQRGFESSPTHELQIDESIIGWKEFELEVIRDKNDNCIIVCSIENVDPMGIHTGDSITVAPIQTLTDKEYQKMRDAAIKVLREIGIETGGSNVQFAVNPENGRLMVIEMNPRVSRSSALASKATGFPIAKVAAKLAVGYTLDELRNEITGKQVPASFEPTIDYVVTKIPRFNFEKFPTTEPRLTTQMKSVGEVMAIGRNFQESLQKALRSLEIDSYGFHPKINHDEETKENLIKQELRNPGPDRIWYIADAFRCGFSLKQIQTLTHIDPWFLIQIQELVNLEQEVTNQNLTDFDKPYLHALKKKGFSDYRLAELLGVSEHEFRNHRQQLNVRPVYKRVDTCAAEFATDTAYLYSTYDEENECRATQREKIMILGSGPNRIGQGIEFDYCCTHASLAIRDAGFETIMVNCNPETVSTDFDISDRLYFEPLTLEDVLEIIHNEQPKGVIVQYGGQTPLKLANPLDNLNVPIIGTSPDAIDRAEDRERFHQLVDKLDLLQPLGGTVRNIEEGLRLAKVLAYPLLARPSYVLGGRAMTIIHNEQQFTQYLKGPIDISPQAPLLLDQFLDDAIEVDVDAVCDEKDILIGGILEHIEQAGIHSGDSSCVLPPHSLSQEIQNILREQIQKLAKELGVIGLINAQFAIKDNKIYILEVNPRASRTVPFIAKATGVPLAKIAARCVIGKTLKQQGCTKEPVISYFAVKQVVFPFARFPNVDPLLGPEMRSTGEVMGIGKTFGEAFAKGQLSTGQIMPKTGRVFISVRDSDKKYVAKLASDFHKFGFEIVATRGTAKKIRHAGIPCKTVNKVREGRPHIVDMIKNNEIDFIINTTEGKQAVSDSYSIRRNAIQHKISYSTTIAGGQAACLASQYDNTTKVISLQDLYKSGPGGATG